MLAGLLFSRALLSVSMIVFVAWVIVSEKGYRRWKRYAGDTMSWVPATLIIPVLVSYFWSNNIPAWLSSLQVKLPLLFIPLAVALANMDDTGWRKVLKTFTVLMFVGMAWSVYVYFRTGNDSSIYLEGRVMNVPMYNDHVRFGWALALVWLFLLDDWWRHRSSWIAFAGLILAVYIHWMGARTGVLYFYLVSLFFLAARYRRLWLPGLVSLLLFLLIAWVLVPSFSNRVRLMVWDFQNYSRGNYVSGLPDQNRVHSARAGIHVFSENIVKGVGFGDVEEEKNTWYSRNMPEVKDEDRVALPGSLLWYACGAGLPALLLLGGVLLFPFRQVTGSGNWFLPASFFSMVFIQACYEPFLELQFGVFLYSFFGALVWQLYKKRE
jgi:hypothetical protein